MRLLLLIILARALYNLCHCQLWERLCRIRERFLAQFVKRFDWNFTVSSHLQRALVFYLYSSSRHNPYSDYPHRLCSPTRFSRPKPGAQACLRLCSNQSGHSLTSPRRLSSSLILMTTPCSCTAHAQLPSLSKLAHSPDSFVPLNRTRLDWSCPSAVTAWTSIPDVGSIPVIRGQGCTTPSVPLRRLLVSDAS